MKNIKKRNLVLYILTFAMMAYTSCSETKKEQDTVPMRQEIKQDTAQSIIETQEQSAKVLTRTVYDSTKWTRILDVDATIVEDMRYATTDNFVGIVLYDCAACYLRPEAAEAIGKAHKILKEKGYGGLKMFDCYRPRPIQQKLWDKVPNASYVTPPWKGSMHNRGLAVDLTIIDSLGNQLDMGTKFDYFGQEGHHTYLGHSPDILANRKLLKETMFAVGFRHIRTEWWHYSFTKASYPVSDWLWDCF